MWNPVYRTFNPREADNQATIWWTDRSDGPMPLIHDLAHFHHAAVATASAGVSKSYRRRTNRAAMLKAMPTMTEGHGRFTTLRTYVGGVGCQLRNMLGRDLTYKECRKIAKQGNATFAEPLTASEVEDLASYFHREQANYSARQRKRSQSPKAVEQHIDEKNAASKRYFQVLDTQRMLSLVQGGNRPTVEVSIEDLVVLTSSSSLWDGYRFSEVELVRALEFSGKWGSHQHVAYVLDWQRIDLSTGETLGPDGEKVRNLIRNGTAKGYTRELVRYPVNAPRLPVHIRSGSVAKPIVFGVSAANDL